MLSVVTLSVIMLSVVPPSKVTQKMKCCEMFH
jgi:hypothetical protein